MAGLSALPARGSSITRSSGSDPLEDVFRRDSVTILVTDSGLGGLSVCARLDRGLGSSRAFGRVRLVFANALPGPAHTYNGMASDEARLRVFDDALEGMWRWYRPDALVIACNTLSALYPRTRFSGAAPAPVIGIVDFGVSAMAKRLAAVPPSTALVLGTPVTISSGVHRVGLVAAGIPERRIVTQACPALETEIQADPGSDVVKSLIEACAMDALAGIPADGRGALVVGLCCTHYAYSADVFAQVFREQWGDGIELVDPNAELSAFFLRPELASRHAATAISVEVVSRVALSDGERHSIAAAVRSQSPRTADALLDYRLKPDLFPFRQTPGRGGH